MLGEEEAWLENIIAVFNSDLMDNVIKVSTHTHTAAKELSMGKGYK